MNPITFELANDLVVITPECLGYRSLSVMVLFGLALAICKRLPFLRSIMLVGTAGLLAIVGNLTRIGIILLVALFDGDIAFGPVHDMAGYVIIVFESIVLASVCDYHVRKSDKRKASEDVSETH